jgi:2-C-methyl-D-erythritol 2,4-cyclodiphosphate synthase
MFRIGHGYDVHKFSAHPKPLIVAGLEVDPEMGVLAHSDGDVVLHALCDAILGSVCMRDIGFHFPDSDVKFKGKNSDFFVVSAQEMAAKKGYVIGNIDITIVAQVPKFLNYIEAMKVSIQNILSLGDDKVNIKATTTEKLGFVGRKEGIAAHAVVLMNKT